MKKKKSFWKNLSGIERAGIIGLSLLLVVGALGGTGVFDRTTSQGGDSPTDTTSFLSRLNPFAEKKAVGSGHQLGKEFVYVGDQMLAVVEPGAEGLAPADVAIWRPGSGDWWVLGSPPASNSITQNWGTTGDIPLPRDYDGDKKADFAVFRPSTNTWWILKSSGGSAASTFGTSGDIPVPADYDGDGLADIAVFRPSDKNWYILKSSNGGLMVLNFGLSTDLPAPGDFDGDGIDEVAVWRDSSKTFYSLNSSNSQLSSAVFANNSTEPLPADYDGDGRDDYAIRSGADWHIFSSSAGALQAGVTWQLAGDAATPHDFDGDGKTDLAVRRPGNGTFYIRNSSDLSQTTKQWGNSTDIPVPANYRR